jgi:DNA mismatch repair protein MutS2
LEGKLAEVQRQSKKIIRETQKPAAISVADDISVLNPGDLVVILSLNAEGEILEINGENILVTYGESMITMVKQDNLRKVKSKKDRKPEGGGRSFGFDWSISQRKMNFKPSIDIRGKRGEEAVDIVRNFIDDATVVGVSELRILHGKGNGILKSMVREYLKSLDIVSSCKDEHVEHGGSGITVVKLDF